MEAVINLIGKFCNSSPVNNILDFPILLSFRWESTGKWLCPRGGKKRAGKRSPCTCAFLCSTTESSRTLHKDCTLGSLQHDPQGSFPFEALMSDWTSRQWWDYGSSPEQKLPEQQQSLSDESCKVVSALLALSDRTPQPSYLMLYYILAMV